MVIASMLPRGPAPSVINFLQDIPETSIFHHLISQSDILKTFRKSHHVHKVCYTEHACVETTSRMGKQLKPSIHNSFTIIAPTNQMLRKTDLKTLITNKKLQGEFVLEHILLGKLGEDGGEQDGGGRGGTVRASVNQSSVWLSGGQKESRVLVHRDKRWNVLREVTVEEGTLYIVDQEVGTSTATQKRKRPL